MASAGDYEAADGAPRRRVGYSTEGQLLGSGSASIIGGLVADGSRSMLKTFKDLPSYLQDNEFIRSGYRPQLTWGQALRSIFQLHNETFNVWTHFIGFLLFLGLAFSSWHAMPRMPNQAAALQSKLHSIHTSISEELHALSDQLSEITSQIMPVGVPRWPIYVFLAGAMFCMLCSSFCHLFHCHSERMSSILWRFDYAGIAAMVATSFYPPMYYAFLCQPLVRDVYLTIITVLGVAAAVFSLMDRFQTKEYRVVRAGVFTLLGAFGILPVVHKLISMNQEPAVIITTMHEVAMGLIYMLGALIYAVRIPERWRPGTFDIAGASHQIFHVLIVLGAIVHYRSALVYLEWRDADNTCPT